jgi:hypothetical protein
MEELTVREGNCIRACLPLATVIHFYNCYSLLCRPSTRSFHCYGSSSLLRVELISLWIPESDISPPAWNLEVCKWSDTDQISASISFSEGLGFSGSGACAVRTSGCLTSQPFSIYPSYCERSGGIHPSHIGWDIFLNSFMPVHWRLIQHQYICLSDIPILLFLKCRIVSISLGFLASNNCECCYWNHVPWYLRFHYHIHKSLKLLHP